MAKKIRVGVIGYGWVATAHIPALNFLLHPLAHSDVRSGTFSAPSTVIKRVQKLPIWNSPPGLQAPGTRPFTRTTSSPES